MRSAHEFAAPVIAPLHDGLKLPWRVWPHAASYPTTAAYRVRCRRDDRRPTCPRRGCGAMRSAIITCRNCSTPRAPWTLPYDTQVAGLRTHSSTDDLLVRW